MINNGYIFDCGRVLFIPHLISVPMVIGNRELRPYEHCTMLLHVCTNWYKNIHNNFISHAQYMINI